MITFDRLYDACSLMISRYLQVGQHDGQRAVLNADHRYHTYRMHNVLQVEWLDVARETATCIEAPLPT